MTEGETETKQPAGRTPRNSTIDDRLEDGSERSDAEAIRRPARRAWFLTGIAAVFCGLAIARWFVADDALPMIWISSGALWVFLPAYLIALVALVRRRWLAAGLSGVAVLAHLVSIGPTLVPSLDLQTMGPEVRVVAANVLYVNQTPNALLDELLESEADILVLEEVSPRWVEALDQARVHAAYPHRDMLARQDAFGIAVLSRHPIVTSELVDLTGAPMMDATVDVDGLHVRVFGVHTWPPYDTRYAEAWRAQLRELEQRVAQVEGPLVVMGDFNGTLHNARVAALRDHGLRDAHAWRGRGWASTWPNGFFPVPSLALDHVFVSRHFVPTDVREGVGAGSDHRPVIVDLVAVDV